MSYLCNIYENVIVLVTVCLFISIFLFLISFKVDSNYLFKKLILIGLTGVAIMSITLVLLPSKSFICGA